MNAWIFSGLITFGALQIADIATTERAIRAGAVEQNPIYIGDESRINRRKVLIKAGIMGGVTLATLSVPKKVGVTMVWGLNGVYAGVVINNIRVARREELR
jgi:hypothetical protein